jgi:hypothetical protein
MGGSGGGFFRDSDPSEFIKRIRDSEQEAQDHRFDIEVNQYLASELVSYNDRDADLIGKILDDIKSDLNDRIEDTVDLMFGGSIAKHTYVNGLSDVDALVLLNNTELEGKAPSELRDFLRQTLVDRYGEGAVREGVMAITLTHEGHEIQLLPALKSGDGYKVSSWSGSDWSHISPKKFAEALTKVNTAQGGKVVPTVKLAKAIISNLPEQQKLSGYHIESLAVKIFKSYEGSKAPKDMLQHFFERASSAVNAPVTDKTGQSVHVDEYLGSAGSLERRIVSVALGRIATKMKNANGMRSLSQWTSIIGE